MSKLVAGQAQKRSTRARWLIGAACAYLVVCLVGTLLILSFDIQLPLLTGTFLLVFFVGAPVALVVYGVLEAVCEGIAIAVVEGVKWIGRRIRKFVR